MEASYPRCSSETFLLCPQLELTGSGPPPEYPLIPFSECVSQEGPKWEAEESQELTTLRIYPIYSKAQVPKAVTLSVM